MKRIALILTAVAAFTLLSTSAMAGGNYYVGGGHGSVHHGRDHTRLNHQAVNRARPQHNAHDYGIAPWQDARLHGRLNHQASHNRARHHATHDNRAYIPYGGHGNGHGGVVVRTPHFGLRIGH